VQPVNGGFPLYIAKIVPISKHQGINQEKHGLAGVKPLKKPVVWKKEYSRVTDDNTFLFNQSH
jgi:hypothetical protein